MGVTRWCVHPSPDVESIEKVGGTKDPEVERIIQLAPDLVLLNREENRVEDSQALARAGITCHASMPRNAAETAAMVRSIGAAIDRREVAEALAEEILARAARVARHAAGREKVSFAYLIWRKPWIAVGADTFSHSLLADAGGRNVFEGAGERYPRITATDLAAAAPRLVLLSTEPFPFTPSHAVELAAETGLAPRSFRIADGEYLSWHGSRTPAGIDYAAGLIDAARVSDSASGSTSTGAEPR